MEELIVRSVINLSVICLLGYMSQHNDLFDERMRRECLYAVGVVALSIIAETLSVVFVAPNSVHRLINMMSCVVGFGLSPLIALFMINAFRREHTKLRWPVLLPGLVNLLLAILSPFYGLIFYVSRPNVYGRGPLFFVYVFAYLFGIAVFLVELLRTREVYRSGNKIILVGLVLLTLFGTTVQVIMPSVFLSWSTITIVMVLTYTYYVDLLEKHDAVTGLLNRRAYEKRLLDLQSEGRGWVIIFDIDDFKAVNDTYGHRYGDFVLQSVARIIRESYNDVGFGYRIGGDEFCVLSTSGDEQAIRDANDRFIEGLRRARNDDDRIPWVSLGHASYNASSGLDEAVEAADRELFVFKRAHKEHEVQT